MSTKKILAIILGLSVFVALTTPILAKKVLPRAKSGTTTKYSGGTTTGRIGVSARFRSDRRAIVVNFSNLTSARTVSYTLSYATRGTTQGAGGSIDPSTTGATASRELLFGTCSHGVCRYDTGITNAKLVVTYTLNNGKKYSKSFRLKV